MWIDDHFTAADRFPSAEMSSLHESDASSDKAFRLPVRVPSAWTVYATLTLNFLPDRWYWTSVVLSRRLAFVFMATFIKQQVRSKFAYVCAYYTGLS